MSSSARYRAITNPSRGVMPMPRARSAARAWRERLGCMHCMHCMTRVVNQAATRTPVRSALL
eukprot:6204624-Pleurochrysis_carterae.AAC.1